MNLKKLAVTILTDGIRLIDKGSDINEGTDLIIRYQAAGNWVTKEVKFEREPRTLFHPFRRSMFIYTGALPSRVLVKLKNLPLRQWTELKGRDRSSLYEESNFSSYPSFNDSSWGDESYRPFFYQPEETKPTQGVFTGGGGTFGGAGATGDWNAPAAPEQQPPAPAPVVEPTAPSTPAPSEAAPIEEPRIEATLVGPGLTPVENISPEIPAIDSTAGEGQVASAEDTSGTKTEEPLEQTLESSTQGTSEQEPNAY